MKLMTEAEWERSADPRWMLEQVERRILSHRQSLLFTAAYLRRLWPILMYEESRVAVEMLERIADGLATAETQQAALRAATKVAGTARRDCDTVADSERHSTSVISAVEAAASAARSALASANSEQSPQHVAWSAAFAHWLWERTANSGVGLGAESACQAALLRDIVGPLPFRPSLPRVDPTLFRWNDGLIPRLVRSIYEERTLDCLPILADALEDAGCDNGDILGHCRGSGPHVRGCWVVDLLLGKS